VSSLWLNAPGNGGEGQNQDDVYMVDARDLVHLRKKLKVYVRDDGLDTVFGPFKPGTKIN
jgi:hypothetical protein